MRLARLTEEGLECFEAELDRLKSEAPDGDLTLELQRDPRFMELIDGPTFAPEEFKTRFSFAAAIDEILADERLRPFRRDPGFWSWLIVVLFDQVCPRESNGRRKLGARARYVPHFESWRHYYRHLLAGPWMVYAVHREDPRRALALLAGPLHKPGEVVEQLASRQQIVTCPGVVEAMTTLYFNPRTGKLRPGVASKGRGTARRLPTVLAQFDLTYDLYGMTGDEVLELLPSEFERFRENAS